MEFINIQNRWQKDLSAPPFFFVKDNRIATPLVSSNVTGGCLLFLLVSSHVNSLGMFITFRVWDSELTWYFTEQQRRSAEYKYIVIYTASSLLFFKDSGLRTQCRKRDVRNVIWCPHEHAWPFSQHTSFPWRIKEKGGATRNLDVPRFVIRPSEETAQLKILI